jgi:CBS domain-containing protein
MKHKTAADVMTTAVVTVNPETLLTDAIELLLRHSISGLPVVDDANNLVGIISEHDIMNFAFSGDADTAKVGEAMTREVITFPPDSDLITLVNSCAAKRLRRTPIVENGKLVGIVSRRDILREMLEMYNNY